MAGLGILIAWFGYGVMYYGITQVQSGNWGFLDLMIPGRWTPATASTPRDQGASTPTVAQTNPTTAPQLPTGSGSIPGVPQYLGATGPWQNPAPGDIVPPQYNGPGPA